MTVCQAFARSSLVCWLVIPLRQSLLIKHLEHILYQLSASTVEGTCHTSTSRVDSAYPSPLSSSNPPWPTIPREWRRHRTPSHSPHSSTPFTMTHSSPTSSSFSDEELEEDTDNTCGAEPRKHTCALCRKKFNRPSSLRIHMNTHTGVTRACPLLLIFSANTRSWHIQRLNAPSRTADACSTSTRTCGGITGIIASQGQDTQKQRSTGIPRMRTTWSEFIQYCNCRLTVRVKRAAIGQRNRWNY